MNHRVALYKRADKAIVDKPNPYDQNQGWARTDEGVLEPVWSCGPILPSSLVDLLCNVVAEGGEEFEEEEEFDYNYFIDSDDEW